MRWWIEERIVGEAEGGFVERLALAGGGLDY